MSDYLPVARMIVLFTLLVASAYTDLAQGKLFNKVTVPALVLGVVINYWSGGLWAGSARGLIESETLLGSLLAMGIGGGLLFFYYMKGGIGAGDVKLMAAVGAIGTLKNLFIIYALLYSSMIGALMAISLLIWKGMLWVTIKRSFKSFFFGGKVSNPDSADGGKAVRLTIPFGFAVSLGSMIAWFVTSGILT